MKKKMNLKGALLKLRHEFMVIHSVVMSCFVGILFIIRIVHASLIDSGLEVLFYSSLFGGIVFFYLEIKDIDIGYTYWTERAGTKAHFPIGYRGTGQMKWGEGLVYEKLNMRITLIGIVVVSYCLS